MDDPVETSSGHTFERAAIMRWLEEGNNFCPLTKMPLSKIRAAAEQDSPAIDRGPELQSNDEEEVLRSLTKLQDLCKRSEVHREWVVMEDYVPIIAGLLCEKNGELRMHALAVLYCLAKDGNDNKERIANVNDSITYIVRSLARKVEESVLALQLLLELSRSTYVRDLIGGVQGCILLLVTSANSDDAQASKYAEEVLDNLAFLDQNVVEMAKSKFFKPLLQRLCEGPLSMQTIMAEALADVELTDHNKLSLSKDGALKPLLQMLEQTDIDIKSASVRALQNLSGVAQNGLQLIKEGAKAPLFELLFCHTLSSSTKLREHVAKTIMHMAESTTSSEAFGERVVLLEREDDVFKLFSLISYSGPDMQETLLLTFRALCGSSCGLNIRTNLRQICAVKVLVQLCELDDLPAVRQNAVKLLHLLTQDGDHETFTDHVTNKCITTLVKIIETSDDPNETAAAMGIISHLPRNPQMSQHLLDANALEAISDCLTFKNVHSSHEKELLEHAAQALTRFTVPTNIEWQLKVAEIGLIPVLVKHLSVGSPLTKRNVCVSLKQFSENSRALSLPVKQARFLGCCSASSADDTCPVHAGICSVESSFCLLEASAVKPLVMVLGENDDGACEASLDAILTLIDGVQLQNGCAVIEEAEGVIAIIKMLNSTCTKLQEKTLGALQRIFRIVEFKTKYGKSAQIPLVDITQRGSRDAKSMAAKILAQLNVLNEQSSFF
ncbi:U-box domain-containing protein 43 [Phtheirospermum japonicum]|uniref:RING-type E3 ubiquitin transferase n=1 Tax=Phtheirospermum japonicum TaxID=374723 RepID=A0A830BZK7_9LAMI|nr:U-box domain-containing protein 43 [Phtheirospermum japonicum]